MMKMLLSSLFIFLIAVFSVNRVAAQTDSGKPTPEQLALCKQMGINAEECSEQAILSKRCLGSVQGCGHAEDAPINPNVALASLYLGIVGAFVTSVLYVKKAGRWKVKIL